MQAIQRDCFTFCQNTTTSGVQHICYLATHDHFPGAEERQNHTQMRHTMVGRTQFTSGETIKPSSSSAAIINLEKTVMGFKRPNLGLLSHSNKSISSSIMLLIYKDS